MRIAILAPLVVLAACGDGMTDAQKKAKDDADVAYVEGLDNAKPPPEPIQPQAIGYPEIEKYKLSGASCAFAPGNSIAAIVIAMDQTAWMKIDGRMLRFAADQGGKPQPMDTWSKYDGKEYSLEFEIDQAGAQRAGSETVHYPGTVAVHDPYDQLVFAAKGTVQCGG